MAWFIVLWAISPLILIPVLVVYILKDKENESKLRTKDAQIAEYTARNRELTDKLYSSGADVSKTEIKQEKAEPVKLEDIEPIVQESPVYVKATDDKRDMVHDEVVMENEQVEVAESTEAAPERKAEESVSETGYEQVPDDKRTYSEHNDSENGEGYVRTSGVYMFGIGVLLVLIAGTIFATTKWKYLDSIAKIGVLLGAVAVFYISAWIAEKKLLLKETSIAFFILGSGAMAFINLAAGYFGWYGEYFKEFDHGGTLIWGITTLIIALCLFAGRWLYEMPVMGSISYIFAIFTVGLLTAHATDKTEIRLMVYGVFFIISVLGVSLYERYGECGRLLKRIIRVLSYINIFAIWIAGLGLYAHTDDIDTSVVVTLYILGVIGIVLATFLYRTQSCEDTQKELSKAKGFGRSYDKGERYIGAGGLLLSVVAFCELGRIAELKDINSVLAWVIILAVWVYEIIKSRKNTENDARDIKREVLVNTACAFAAVLVIHAFGTVDVIGIQHKDIKNVLRIAVLIIAALQYVIHTRFSKTNHMAWIPAAVAYYEFGNVVYKLIRSGDAETDAVYITAFLIIEIAVAVSVVLSRLLRKQVFVRTEGGYRIEWCSIAAGIPLIMSLAVAEHLAEGWLFGALMLIAAYFASYYGRVNKIAQRILLTISVLVFTVTMYLQPFVEIKDIFMADWTILMILMGAGLLTLVYRESKRTVTGIWAVSVAICFIIMFNTIADEAGYLDNKPVYYNIAVYLAGVIALFIISYLKKNRVLLIETGAVLMLFSFLADEVDAFGIFVIAAVIGVAYMIYLHTIKLSKWSFLAIAQIYILMFIYEPDTWAWIVAFVTSVAAGVALHLYLDHASGDDDSSVAGKMSANRTWMDDQISVSAIIPLLRLFSEGDDSIRCISTLLLAVFVLSFYRRYKKDKYAKSNRYILTVTSLIVLSAWLSQPWLEIEKMWKSEWAVAGIMLTAVFNMIAVYKSKTDEKAGWGTFYMACACSLWLLCGAIVSYEAGDALALGIVMIAVLIWAYITRKKQWFMMSALTLFFLIISSTRTLWMSIEWWIYLLVAGATLIGVAASNEYKKRHNMIKEKKVLFKDWGF